MKIKVSNLGPIRGPAEFDLKPLTIFIGPNNAGKTWLAYTLAGIFSSHGWGKYTDGRLKSEFATIYPPLAEAIEKLLATGTSKMNMLDFVDKYGQRYFENLALYTHEWLSDFMGTQKITFGSTSLSIDLAEHKEKLIDRVLAEPYQFFVGISEKSALITARKKSKQQQIHMYAAGDTPLEEELPRDIIEDVLLKSILHLLHTALYPNVVTLPTERTAYITLPFNALLHGANNDQIQMDGKQEEEMHVYGLPMPRPVWHYIQSVIRASSFGAKKIAEREKSVKGQVEIKEYMRLAEFLEKSILGGKIDFSHPEPEPARKIHFQPAREADPLEISITSSMIKELTPLVFYLRYFARPGELLVIDEPEMNLHPKAQVQIIEFLAMLVNAGLHVLITTHSPYMIDHITNLFKASEHTDQDTISKDFFLQDKRAFIAKDNTGVYLVNNGTITDALDDEQDWDSFGAVSDQISDIYFKL